MLYVAHMSRYTPAETRMHRFVDMRDTDECLLWRGAKRRGGYGYIMEYGKAVTATHVAMRMAGNPRPSVEAMACHKCDNPRCVNPRHLFWGSQTDNMRDNASKGRHHYANRATCKHGHEWTPENTLHHPGRKGLAPHRVCLTCCAATRKRFNAARRIARAAQKLAKANARDPY